MRKLKVSVILNFVIFAMTATGVFMTLTGIELVGGEYDATYGFLAFKYFTVQSNFIGGVYSLFFAIFGLRVLRGKTEKMPRIAYGLKLVFTVALAVTFIVVACVLAPFIETGYFSMYLNANFFFHFAIPLLSVITFAFYEGAEIKFRYTCYALVPTSLYGVFYVTVALTHMEGGVVSPDYDWYKFMSSGALVAVGVGAFIFAFTFLFAVFLRFINKKVYAGDLKQEQENG